MCNILTIAISAELEEVKKKKKKKIKNSAELYQFPCWCIFF